MEGDLGACLSTRRERKCERVRDDMVRPKKKLFVSHNGPKKNRVGRSVKE